jgi:SAM-dependent methyltransferase
MKELQDIVCPVCSGKMGNQNKVPYPDRSVRNQDGSLYFSDIVFCTTCGLGVAYPEAKDEALSDFYKKGGFWKKPHPRRIVRDAMIPFLLAKSRWENIEEALANSFFGQPISVLDIGAGYGFIGMLADKSSAFNLVKYTCVEPDEEMREYITGSWKRQSQKNSLEIKASLEEVRGEYEVVVLSHVLEHVAKPLDMIKSSASCLKENGILLVDVPNQDYKFKESFFPHLLFFSNDSLQFALKQEKSISIISFFNYGREMQKSPLCKNPPFSIRLLSNLGRIAKFILPNKLLSLFFIRFYGIDSLDPNGTWIRAICKKQES